jgi:hypothetical protein
VLLESSLGFHSLRSFRRVAVGPALFQLGLSVARRGNSHLFDTELMVGLQNKLGQEEQKLVLLESGATRPQSLYFQKSCGELN